MASYGDILMNAIRFSIHPRRWLPFFILDSVFLLAAVGLILTNMSDILGMSNMGMGMGNNAAPMAVLYMVNLGLIMISGFVVWSLIRLWISGAVIHQSVKPKEFGNSWGVAKSRFFSLLAVTIIVGLISGVVGVVPYIGWVLSIIVGLAFLFAMPAVVVKRLGFENSLRESYRIFRNKPFTVFLIWLAMAIISIIITIIFLIPLFMTVWGIVAPFLFQASSATIASLLLMSLMQNVWMLVIGMEVLLVGVAISSTFTLKAETDFYLKLRKRKYGVF